MLMKNFILRISNAYHRHGLTEFIRLSELNLRYYIGALFRSLGDGAPDDDFDRVYGTETAGIREIGSLYIPSANSRAAVRYEPSSERSIRDLIERAKADLDL